MAAVDPPHPPLPDLRAEWLEADGLGGFATGTVGGARTRRYHALLCAAARPPVGRCVLVNGLDALVETDAGPSWISSQRYAPGVTAPDGARRITAFSRDPWPRWTYALEGGLRLEHEVLAVHGAPAVALAWRLAAGQRLPERATLEVRLFFSGRDYHALHHENGAFAFGPEAREKGRVLFRPYGAHVPGVLVLHEGDFAPAPCWYRRFEYDEERARGLDALEDCAAPGVLRFDLLEGEAAIVLAAEGIAGAPLTALEAPAGAAPAQRTGDLGRAFSPPGSPPRPQEVHDDGPAPEGARALVARLRERERARRAALGPPPARAADAYVVRRGKGKTIVAGYPWFTDWGRDTFIAMRGLLLATGRLDEARDVLLAWSNEVSEGMLPNRFCDGHEKPEYNSVDASLWFCVAVREYFAAREKATAVTSRERSALTVAVLAIVEGYARGTRYGIRCDPEDGLLCAGAPGVQLTWMDAKVDGWVVTPRAGKPVEVNALWVNALDAAARLIGETSAPRSAETRLADRMRQAEKSFLARFPDATSGGLLDVVDAGGEAGAADASVRPNQVLAVGGLPRQLVKGDAAKRIVDLVEARLWTPLGLRTLDPRDPRYRARYGGGPRDRDGAYHQGTVWPWLLGPFVEAWVRVRGGTRLAKDEARARFLAPLREHVEAAGLGHVGEIADGDPPHEARGCPFQAWSLGEMLRLERVVLA